MKRLLLFVIALTFGSVTMAQLVQISKSHVVRDVPAAIIDLPVVNPLQTSNPFVNNKAVLENDLGLTRYDLQTNEAIQDRIYAFPDGTVAAAWTTSMQDASWTDRGSGYNYFDGTAWGPLTTVRIETSRTGWPSIAAWNGNGEIVLAHNTSTNWVMNTRPVKGTGSWTQTLGPAAPTGVMGLGWPRMITNGNNHQNIHIIGLSLGTGNPPGAVYNGLDGALLYWRSLDGGATWDKLGVQLPGLDSSNYSSFSGDEYAWGSPKGDTIYFAVAGPYTDTFIMKSTDNGASWSKITILNNDLYKKLPNPLPPTTEIPPWRSSDGSIACEMDKSGIIHFASGIGGGSVTGGAKYIRLNNNGLIYWNTTMPILKDSLDLDTLLANGQLLGYYSDGPNPGDTLQTVTGYRVGLTSFPQISVDAYNNLYVIYSGVTWQNPDPTGINYRHIFGRAKFHDQTTWSTDPIDFNDNIMYFGTEFIFAAMAKQIANDKLQLVYQTAFQPGTAVGTTGTAGAIPFHDNTIQYREIPGNTFWPTGIDGNPVVIKNFVGQNYPNPVKGTTAFHIDLNKSANVIVEVSNVMGQKVMTLDKGLVNSGAQKYTIDCSQFNAGIYFYTVKINGESYTHKMIVE